jgi:hypothetical protein
MRHELPFIAEHEYSRNRVDIPVTCGKYPLRTSVTFVSAALTSSVICLLSGLFSLAILMALSRALAAGASGSESAEKAVPADIIPGNRNGMTKNFPEIMTVAGYCSAITLNNHAIGGIRSRSP